MQGSQGVPASATGSVRPARQPTASSQLLQALQHAKLHRNPRFLGTVFLWLFGLYAVFLSPAPVTITDEKLARFEQRLKILSDLEKPRQAAEQRWLQAEMDVRNAKAWFWRFKPAVRERVYKKQAKSAEARKAFQLLDKESQRKYADAKAELGLWSDAGIQEGRKLFWKAFESGKVFGRRQTFWDALARLLLTKNAVTLLTSREEGVLGMLVQLIIQAMINFTTGMVASVFVFVFQLPSFLWSYQPSLISGLAFFVIAVVGAVSVIASFLLALYGAGATAVYSIATISPNMRIGTNRRRRHTNLRYHYD